MHRHCIRPMDADSSRPHRSPDEPMSNREKFSRPSGTSAVGIVIHPSDESLGYSQSSLAGRKTRTAAVLMLPGGGVEAHRFTAASPRPAPSRSSPRFPRAGPCRTRPSLQRCCRRNCQALGPRPRRTCLRRSPTGIGPMRLHPSFPGGTAGPSHSCCCPSRRTSARRRSWS